MEQTQTNQPLLEALRRMIDQVLEKLSRMVTHVVLVVMQGTGV
jgi:type III secretory pathway component EscU